MMQRKSLADITNFTCVQPGMSSQSNKNQAWLSCNDCHYSCLSKEDLIVHIASHMQTSQALEQHHTQQMLFDEAISDDERTAADNPRYTSKRSTNLTPATISEHTPLHRTSTRFSISSFSAEHSGSRVQTPDHSPIHEGKFEYYFFKIHIFDVIIKKKFLAFPIDYLRFCVTEL